MCILYTLIYDYICIIYMYIYVYTYIHMYIHTYICPKMAYLKCSWNWKPKFLKKRLDQWVRVLVPPPRRGGHLSERDW